MSPLKSATVITGIAIAVPAVVAGLTLLVKVLMQSADGWLQLLVLGIVLFGLLFLTVFALESR